MTKYVSKDCDCVDRTRKFTALLVEAQAKWKVLKCEQVKIADHLYDIFDYESVQFFPEKKAKKSYFSQFTFHNFPFLFAFNKFLNLLTTHF